MEPHFSLDQHGSSAFPIRMARGPKTRHAWKNWVVICSLLTHPLFFLLPLASTLLLKMRFSATLSSLLILAMAAFAAPSEVSDPRKCGNKLDVINMEVEAVMFVLLSLSLSLSLSLFSLVFFQRLTGYFYFLHFCSSAPMLSPRSRLPMRLDNFSLERPR